MYYLSTIYITQRVDSHAVHAHLKVQMRAGTVTRVARKSNFLPLRNGLSGLYKDP